MAASSVALRRPGFALPLERAAPTLAAAVLAAVYLAFDPLSSDLAAHVFRAGLFEREGFTLWNGQWYGGHHTPAYSVLFPPLAWLSSPQVVGALAAVASAALFESLARSHFGPRARWGALWFGVATSTSLFTGRLPFALGVALGLAALLAFQHRRRALAYALALACPLGSPVAGLFLGLAAVALALTGARRRDALVLAAAALLPPLLLSAAFPEGGYQPFVFSSFYPLPLFALAAIAVLPPEERALRIGAALYGAAGTLSYLVETPMGGNAVRLGTLFGGPLLVCALAGRGGRFPRSAVLLAPLLAGLLFWQWTAPGRELLNAGDDPSGRDAYYRPLLGYLAAHPGEGRIEIPFSRSHWESAAVAPHHPLARGWERQLDTGRNPIFYDGTLNHAEYEAWLSENAVRIVAVPRGHYDRGTAIEARLASQDPPYLDEVWRTSDWRVYRVTAPHPMVIPERGADVRLARLGSDRVELDVRRPGAVLLRVRWTRYWRAPGACIEPSRGWTRVVARRSGRLRMTTSFSPSRLFDGGRRCA